MQSPFTDFITHHLNQYFNQTPNTQQYVTSQHIEGIIQVLKGSDAFRYIINIKGYDYGNHTYKNEESQKRMQATVDELKLLLGNITTKERSVQKKIDPDVIADKASSRLEKQQSLEEAVNKITPMSLLNIEAGEFGKDMLYAMREPFLIQAIKDATPRSPEQLKDIRSESFSRLLHLQLGNDHCFDLILEEVSSEISSNHSDYNKKTLSVLIGECLINRIGSGPEQDNQYT